MDNDEVAERIEAKVKKGDLGDELVEQMSGLDVSTIDFLRIQFRDEWDNFVQRILGRYKLQGVVDPDKVTERDFRISEKGIFHGTLFSMAFTFNSIHCPVVLPWLCSLAITKLYVCTRHSCGGTQACVFSDCASPDACASINLAFIHAAHPEARMDLMLWASERGQMLSRTVKGMMMYATALTQLEYIETVDDRGSSEALAKAVEGKYRCACCLTICCGLRHVVPAG